MNLVKKIADELKLQEYQVANTVQLLFEDECTIPFVARYRKERHGSLDEVQIKDVRDRYQYLIELEDTKKKYLKVVEEHCHNNPAYEGKFPELKQKFEACTTKNELDDLYLPFKPKRRTRAQQAREQGLEPLLEEILQGRTILEDLEIVAAKYVTKEGADIDAKLRVESSIAALSGASDIYAEIINETADLRAVVRELSYESGEVVTSAVDAKLKEVAEAGASETASKPAVKKDKGGKKVDASKYTNYFDYREPLAKIPPHRIMAVRRGEAEKVLRLAVEVDEARILTDLKSRVIGNDPVTPAARTWFESCISDAYRRLLQPSIETEIRLFLKTNAEEEAIKVFSRNLANLLLLPPLPQTTVLGIDPGLRTGCKLAVVSETGKLLDHATVYPDPGGKDNEKTKKAMDVISGLLGQYGVRCVAIGNGTGSREIDRVVSRVIKERNHENIKRAVVNEAGASVYSTDQIARDEFPDLDPTIRSAVSIARRLQDPLAELVKIDPRSIGVGQYQHDVNVTKLKKSLEEVVESCVNRVGVNVNTASYKLLGYVSGIGPTLAKNIVSFRDKNGGFVSRGQIKDVDGFGQKAFQLAAGFLRVPESPNPLDNSAVHPETYPIVEKIIDDLGKEIQEIIGKPAIISTIPWETYATKIKDVGLPTLMDISAELAKPGRDPREGGARLLFSDDVTELADLTLGMKLKGTVTNVTNFGAFVDIGVHQDGLVHISELANTFVQDPNTVVSVGDVLDVRVIDVDVERRRISLSCRTEDAANAGAGQGQGQQQNRGGSPGGRPQQGGNRGGPSGGRSSGGGGRPQQQPGQGGGPRPYSTPPRGGGRPQQRQPDKSFTMDDLLNKFNKR